MLTEHVSVHLALLMLVKVYWVTSILRVWVSRLATDFEVPYRTNPDTSQMADAAGCFPKIKGKIWFRQHLPEEKTWQLHNI